MKGVKVTELLLITDNKVGKLAEISAQVKEGGINVRAISAWAFDDKAYFRLVVSDNAKARQTLQGLGKLEEKEVVLVDMPDEVGQLFLLTSKLKDNNIDIRYISHKTDVIAAIFQITADHIKNVQTSGMADMTFIINRYPARIDINGLLFQRNKLFLFLG